MINIRHSKIFLVFIAIAILAINCFYATFAYGIASKDKIRYYNYTDLNIGKKLSLIIDIRSNSFSLFSKGNIDALDFPMQFCDESSKFVCFFSDGYGMGFSIPRQAPKLGDTWRIHDTEFVLIKKFGDSYCDKQFLIISRINMTPQHMYLYSYSSGLKIIAEVQGVETLEWEGFQKKTLSFSSILYSLGVGYGAISKC